MTFSIRQSVRFASLGILLSLGALIALAQSSNFPAALDTDAQLGVAVNSCTTYLAADITSGTSTSATLARASCVVPNTVLVIADPATGNEYVWVCAVSGNTITFGRTSCPDAVTGRGTENSIAYPHGARVPVYATTSAWLINSHASSIKAIESSLNTNLANIGVPSMAMNFTPFSLSPGVDLAAGSNTVTISPVPLGINGTDVNHQIWVSGGTGTPEACTITGGTAVSGAASGTLIFTCANTHFDAWTISSVSCGIGEAVQVAYALGGSIVQAAPGTCTMRGSIYLPTLPASAKKITLRGMGRDVTVLDFSNVTTGTAWIYASQASDFGTAIMDLTLYGVQPWAANISTFTHYPPAIKGGGVGRGEIRNVGIYGAWKGIDLVGANTSGWQIDNVYIGCGSVCIDIDGAWDTTRLNNIHIWPFTGTNTPPSGYTYTMDPSVIGIRFGRLDGLLASNIFILSGQSMVFHRGADSAMCTLCVLTNVVTDGFGAMTFAEGHVQMSNVQFTRDNTAVLGFGTLSCSAPALTYTGGVLVINNLQVFDLCQNATYPAIKITNTTGSTLLDNLISFQGSDFQRYGATSGSPSMISIPNSSGVLQYIKIQNSRFYSSAGTVVTAPMISDTSSLNNSQLSITGNTFANDGNAFAETALSIAQDQLHVIAGNSFENWQVSYPANSLYGLYQPLESATGKNGVRQPLSILTAAQLLNLSPAVSRTLVYCKDCKVTSGADNTCNSGGTGALAVPVDTAWRCFATQN